MSIREFGLDYELVDNEWVPRHKIVDVSLEIDGYLFEDIEGEVVTTCKINGLSFIHIVDTLEQRLGWEMYTGGLVLSAREAGEYFSNYEEIIRD